MPVRLYFAMEKQIARIRAETDLRHLAVSSSVMDSERFSKVHQTLIMEQGEVYQLERSKFVHAEAGAINKLKALM
ncbi:hypothetical protein JCM19235_1241 [Vibrio maritimus]|uniref:Uncharacterized protein n=1 Tax=Vibrio maritimus TaxID=990268 RepID=A0A090S5F3_9VIBR|nr:hypothetical protein JCM19235_1241 [Vibrio maritimus]